MTEFAEKRHAGTELICPAASEFSIKQENWDASVESFVILLKRHFPVISSTDILWPVNTTMGIVFCLPVCRYS